MVDEGPPAPRRSQARGGSLQGAALSGHVALVTGASSGIGRHLVQGLADHPELAAAVAAMALDERADYLEKA